MRFWFRLNWSRWDRLVSTMSFTQWSTGMATNSFVAYSAYDYSAELRGDQKKFRILMQLLDRLSFFAIAWFYNFMEIFASFTLILFLYFSYTLENIKCKLLYNLNDLMKFVSTVSSCSHYAESNLCLR